MKKKRRYGAGVWKRGDSWIIEITVKGQRYRESLGPVSRTFAKEEAGRRRTALLEGTLRPKAQDPMLGKFIDAYLENVSSNKAPSTHERDKVSADHLKRLLNGRRISQITRIDLERYKRTRREEILGKGRISMASVNRELALLSHAFNVARLPNPTKGVKRFEEFGRERFLDDQEEEAMFKAVSAIAPGLDPLFRVLINAGYRLGEVLALRNDPEMINFENGYIKIPRTIRKGKKRDVVTPLNPALTDALKRAITSGNIGSGECIFPYGIHHIDKVWRKIREKAGLEDTIRVHDLRHTFGSRAAQAASDDPFAVQALLGHSDFRTTQKYIHVDESRKRAVMERLGRDTHKSPPLREVKSL